MGDDSAVNALINLPGISIHVPRMGDDIKSRIYDRRDTIFLSTSPVWGTTQGGFVQVHHGMISIHVPRMGDDDLQLFLAAVVGIISIHVPRMGDDYIYTYAETEAEQFLSTSPVWGTTLPILPPTGAPKDFYPRPPYGGRRIPPDQQKNYRKR